MQFRYYTSAQIEIRKQNYILNLQTLSDEEIESMTQEYSIMDAYVQLKEIGNKLINLCQNYPPQIHREEQIATIKSRIYSYKKDNKRDNSIKISQLTETLQKIKNNPISAVLPPELIGELITAMFNIRKSNYLRHLDDILGFDRKIILFEEVRQRRLQLMRGDYTNKCVDMLTNGGVIPLEQLFTWTDEEIVKLAHIEKIKSINCMDCNNKVDFTRTYKDNGGTPIYIAREIVYPAHDKIRVGISSLKLTHPYQFSSFSIDSIACPCAHYIVYNIDD